MQVLRQLVARLRLLPNLIDKAAADWQPPDVQLLREGEKGGRVMKEKIPLYIIAAFVLFLLINVLAGCKTKSVTEYVAVHDTTLISKTDTCYKVKTEYSHDTLRVETERVITITKEGDTLKVVEWRDRWRDRVVHSTDTVREKSTDTIYISKDTEHDKETVVKKKSILKPVLVTAFLALMMALCFIIYRKKS